MRGDTSQSSSRGRVTSFGILCLDYYIVSPAKRQRSEWQKPYINFPLIFGLQDWGLGMVERDTPDRPVLPLHMPGGWGLGEGSGGRMTQSERGHPCLFVFILIKPSWLQKESNLAVTKN